MKAIDDYEKVSIYGLDPEIQEQLLSTQRECVFNWCTRDQWPMGVIMSCLWRRDRMWLTAGAHRHRIAAVRRNPQVSVVVTSTGTKLGSGKAITLKGTCQIHEDRETKDWFYPEFSRHLHGENESEAAAFAERLDSPLRVILEVKPEKWITYDGTKMFLHSAGKLKDDQSLTEPGNADTERLERELKRRGLA